MDSLKGYINEKLKVASKKELPNITYNELLSLLKDNNHYGSLDRLKFENLPSAPELKDLPQIDQHGSTWIIIGLYYYGPNKNIIYAYACDKDYKQNTRSFVVSNINNLRIILDDELFEEIYYYLLDE